MTPPPLVTPYRAFYITTCLSTLTTIASTNKLTKELFTSYILKLNECFVKATKLLIRKKLIFKFAKTILYFLTKIHDNATL